MAEARPDNLISDELQRQVPEMTPRMQEQAREAIQNAIRSAGFLGVHSYGQKKIQELVDASFVISDLSNDNRFQLPINPKRSGTEFRHFGPCVRIDECGVRYIVIDNVTSKDEDSVLVQCLICSYTTLGDIHAHLKKHLAVQQAGGCRICLEPESTHNPSWCDYCKKFQSKKMCGHCGMKLPDGQECKHTVMRGITMNCETYGLAIGRLPLA